MTINPMADMDRMAEKIARLEREISTLPSRFNYIPGFWAKLLSATNVANNRWKYSWTEIEFNLTSSMVNYTVPTTPRVGPFTSTVIGGSTGWAWNSTEIDNTDDDAGSGWSDEVISGLTLDFGDTFQFNIEAVNAIGNTNTDAEKWPIVWLRPISLTNTSHIAYMFTGWNTIKILAGD